MFLRTTGGLPILDVRGSHNYNRLLRLIYIHEVFSLQPMTSLQRFDVFPLTGECSEGIDAFRNVLGHASDACARCTGLALGAVSHFSTRCRKSTAPPSSPRQGGTSLNVRGASYSI